MLGALLSFSHSPRVAEWLPWTLVALGDARLIKSAGIYAETTLSPPRTILEIYTEMEAFLQNKISEKIDDWSKIKAESAQVVSCSGNTWEYSLCSFWS